MWRNRAGKSRRTAGAQAWTIAVALAILFAAGTGSAEPFEVLQQQVAQAEHDYDADAAIGLVEKLQAEAARNPDVIVNITLARAALLVAEMRRFDYEEAEGKMDPRDRRLLGRTIDEVARIGLDALAVVPDALSEKWRMTADFYGTMIRSNYKGSKYVSEMENATERAVELDPNNPNALLTASKRPLFAEDNQGGDVPEAMKLLDRAIELDPEYERAYAFRGMGYEKLGEMDKALADWRKAVEIAPNSRMAIKKLEEFAKK